MLRIRALAPLAVALFASAAAAQQDFSAEGADACLKCHESEKIMGILETPHMNADDPKTPAARHECESCHGPSATHMNFPMHVGNIRFTKHAKTPVDERNQSCLECHHEGAREHWEMGPHGFPDTSCADCHSIHKVRDPILSESAQTAKCTEGCHEQIMTTAPANSSHPFTGNDRILCTDCHNPHGPLDLAICATCHDHNVEGLAKQSAKAREYHERALAKKIECTECHKGFVHAMTGVTLGARID